MRAPLLLAVVAFIVTLLAAVATLGSAGYRAVGLRLSDRAEAVRAGPIREALATPDAPLPALVAGLGVSVAKSPLRGAALAGSLCLALASAFVAFAGWRLAGLAGGVVAVATFVLTPGTLFHARTVGPEAAVTLATALLLGAALLRPSVASALLGTAAFLACVASSNEGIFLAVPWLLAAPLAEWTARRERTGSVTLPPLAPSILVPVLVAPLLLFWLWPHLAEDGGKRWLTFLTLPFESPHPPMLVLHDVRDQATTRAPSVVMGLVQVATRLPLVPLCLASFGGWRVARAIRAGAPLRRGAFAVLGLGGLLVVQCVSGGPYYAGVDGVMPMLPFVALLAGVGGATLFGAVRELWPLGRPALAASMVLALIAGSVAVDLVRSFPLEPSARSALVGGTRGAAALGLETRTDTLLPVETLDWLNDALPERARLAFFPQTNEYRLILDGLRRHGLLRPDIESVDPYNATHVATPRAPGEPVFAEAVRELRETIYTVTRDGVTLLTVSPY